MFPSDLINDLPAAREIVVRLIAEAERASGAAAASTVWPAARESD
jgi:hypothetical protein